MNPSTPASFGLCSCGRPRLAVSFSSHTTPTEAVCLVCDESVPAVDFDRWYDPPPLPSATTSDA